MTGVSRIEFDTPASNTCLKNGACTSTARISLGGLPPSRHGTSTSCYFQWHSSGPLFGSTEVPCFAMFMSSSKPGQVMTRQRHMKWLLMTCLTVTHREQMVQFCLAASEGLHQRDDYKEFLQMSLIFLVLKREQGFRFGHQKHSILHCGWRMSFITSIYLCSISSSL